MNEFNIESWQLKKDVLDVIIEKNNIGINIYIPIERFKSFLIINEKLSFELNLSDERGEHKQYSGIMSYDEYFDGKDDYIKQDLYEYITKYPIMYKGLLRSNPLQHLLNQFKNQELCRQKNK